MRHIVIDLEMNKIEKQFKGALKLSSEIIELGAVRMDEHFNIIDSYQTYVSPDYGKMDEHIIELTGITDDKLIGAPKFSKALDMFSAWVGPERTQFYSWSLSDLRQFQNESRFKEYQNKIMKKMEKNWHDFQDEYSKQLGIEKKVRLDQAISAADYEFAGAPHTALADAVNTAEILRLSKKPAEFERIMKPVLELFRIDNHDNTLINMCPDFFASYRNTQDKKESPKQMQDKVSD